VKQLAYVCTALRLFPCLRVEGFIYVPRSTCPLITKHLPSLLYEDHGCMEKGQHTYLLWWYFTLSYVLATVIFTDWYEDEGSVLAKRYIGLTGGESP
jgi:hypothetical protein